MERPQETHNWHIQKLKEGTALDQSMTVKVAGKGDSPFKKAGGPLFHMPIIGGWREYVVLHADAPVWHVGWAIPSGAYLNALPITDPKVRLLRGLAGWEVTFLAFDSTGNQIPLKVVGEGAIGDGQHGSVRLL